MSIDKIDHPWAEQGSLDTTLTNAKRDIGWISGDSPDKPTVERFNVLQNSVENKINDMLYKGPKRTDVETAETSVLTGIYPPGISTIDTASQVDTGKTTPNFVNLAYAKIGGAEKILLCDTTETLGIDIIDKATMSFDGTQSISSATLPTPTTSWHPLAITTDSESAYVLWSDDGDDHQLQAYKLSDWTVKTGWPSTGTLMFTSTSDKLVDVIHATNDTLLAIPNVISEIGSDPNEGVLLIDKSDGTLDSYGAGDQTSGFISERICSNGTYIFTADGHSIDIGTPSTGCGGSNWPRSATGGNYISCIGDIVIINTDTTSPLSYILHVENADLGTVYMNDASVVRILRDVTTDGLYFWAKGEKHVNATVTDIDCFFKIDPYFLSGQSSSVAEETNGENIVTPIAISNATTDGIDGPPVIYDGESFWLVIDRINDSVVRRVSRSNLR